MPADAIQPGSDVFHVAGHRTHLVQRTTECNDAEAAYPPVRWVEPRDAAQSGGLANTPPGVASQSDRG